MPEPKPPNAGQPNQFAVPTLREARALQAFSAGTATEDQQKAAFNWIIRGACGAGAEPFCVGSPDVTAYLAGRLSVSLQIGWVLGNPADAFRKEDDERTTEPD